MIVPTSLRLGACLAFAACWMAAVPAPAAVTAGATQCRAEPSARATSTARLRPAATVQLLAIRSDWSMVRAEGVAPCWVESRSIVQEASDVRAVTSYGPVQSGAGRVTLAPAAKAEAGADCPCSTGRTCRGPSANRYCISRGILTSRGD